MNRSAGGAPQQRRPLIIPEGHLFRVNTVKEGVRSFRIEKKLGEGGAGVVYRAFDDDDGRAVVVKTPKFYGDQGMSSQIEERVLASIDYPNVMRLYGSIRDRYGHHILFYEYLFSNPLLYLNSADCRDRVSFRQDPRARYIPLPPAIAADFGYDLARGVEHLHVQGFVHHDIKLANVLVRLDYDEARISPKQYFKRLCEHRYRAVLIDAGGVRNLAYLEELNRGGTDLGAIVPPEVTPILAPPEVLEEGRLADGRRGRLFTPSLDLYQTAIVLYALFTGHPPYSHIVEQGRFKDLEEIFNLKRAERRGEISPISLQTLKSVRFRGDCPFVARGESVRGRYDEALFELLRKRVDPDPAARGTAEQLRRDLEALFEIRKVRAVSATDSLRERKAYNRRHLPYTQGIFELKPRNRLIEAGKGTEEQVKTQFHLERREQADGPKRTGIIRGFWDPNFGP